MAMPFAVCAYGQVNPAVREAVAYVLTADKLDRYAQASGNVTSLIAKDPAYREKMKPDARDAPQSVDQTVVWSKAHLPEYVAAVEKAGIPFREYIVLQACLVITMEAYKKPQYAASLHVRRENIAFVQGNWARIQGILRAQRK
jgi:hypothetical protein